MSMPSLDDNMEGWNYITVISTTLNDQNCQVAVSQVVTMPRHRSALSLFAAV